jgi:serine/threonine protein kinase
MDGRTVQINQALTTNVAEESKQYWARFKDFWKTGGKRQDALNQLATCISGATNRLLDPKYEKYLPEHTLELYKQLQQAVEDKGTLKSIWKNSSPTKLGEGSYGKVYGSTDGKYIFKVMKPFNADEFDPIEQEINANNILMSGVETMQQSPEAFYTQGVDFVTQYKGVFDLNGQNILVFERAPGAEMAKYLANNPIENSKDITTHARMGAELANGIAITHEAGLIHRDIKPENTMVHVNPDGTVIAKVIDQGLACKNTDQAELSIPCGTRNFMAPEFFKNPPSPVSSTVDVYALGVTLVENFFNSIDTSRQGALGILANPEQHRDLFDPKNVYSNDQFQFLCGLIRDCVNPDPTARPSAAQAGYALEFFAACMDDNARIEAHNAKPENIDHQLEKVTIPPYQDIIALAKQDRPVSVQNQSVSA